MARTTKCPWLEIRRQAETKAVASQQVLREIHIEKMQARLSILRAERIEQGRSGQQEVICLVLLHLPQYLEHVREQAIQEMKEVHQLEVMSLRDAISKSTKTIYTKLKFDAHKKEHS